MQHKILTNTQANPLDWVGWSLTKDELKLRLRENDRKETNQKKAGTKALRAD